MAETRKLEPGEYEAIQQQVMLFASLLRDLELGPFLNAINRTEAVAPLFNPTLWMVGNSKMQFIKRTAEALRAAQAKLPPIEALEKAERETEAAARMAGVDPRTGR